MEVASPKTVSLDQRVLGMAIANTEMMGLKMTPRDHLQARRLGDDQTTRHGGGLAESPAERYSLRAVRIRALRGTNSPPAHGKPVWTASSLSRQISRTILFVESNIEFPGFMSCHAFQGSYRANQGLSELEICQHRRVAPSEVGVSDGE